MRRSWSTVLVVVLLGASCALHATTLLRLNKAERRLESALDIEEGRRLVDDRLAYYAEAMRDGASFDTTSTEATFWWVGYSAARAYSRQAEFCAAFETSLQKDGMLAMQFRPVHQVIDGRTWRGVDPPEPFLAYTED